MYLKRNWRCLVDKHTVTIYKQIIKWIYPPDEQTELFYTSELKLLQSVRSLKDYM